MLMVVAVAARAVAARAGWVTFTSVLGALLVIGAGFNGASFLDFGLNFSSLLMELLALDKGTPARLPLGDENGGARVAR